MSSLLRSTGGPEDVQWMGFAVALEDVEGGELGLPLVSGGLSETRRVWATAVESSVRSPCLPEFSGELGRLYRKVEKHTNSYWTSPL